MRLRVERGSVELEEYDLAADTRDRVERGEESVRPLDDVERTLGLEHCVCGDRRA